MGTWGTAIFSDDLASDIKTEFKNKIAFGQTSGEATEELLIEYSDELNDTDNYSVFWLSLALTQWDIGRLLNFVKEKALEIIENGNDLERWKRDEKNLKKRKIVLEKLKDKLLSEQPKEKKIPRPFIRQTNLEKGDLISYKLKNGKLTVLRVIDIRQDQLGDRYPLIEAFNFYGDTIPQISELSKFEIINLEKDGGFDDGFLKIKPSKQFYLSPFNKKDCEPIDRIKVLARNTSVTKRKGSSSIIWWKEIDNKLINEFEEI